MNKWSRPFEGRHASALPAGSGFAPVTHHYFAFLSYSHADAAIADWLHREIERFRVPSGLAGRLTANGVVPKRLSPIFRDRHELAAGRDLDAEIRQALAASRCLIVLCSPAAADSQWTNAEIEEFKRAHPDGCIIAAIVAGEPFASDKPGAEKDECFPAALRQKYDRRGRPTGRRAEPLAADLRESADGKRMGLLKIVAGILGVGLDDLVQRDHLRRQRRLAGIAAGSLGGMIVAALLAVTAIEARDAARDQRQQAEKLIGFMLGDLTGKLEPIGRLDVLDSVGAAALSYYETQDTSELSDEALAQRSKALTLMGQVASIRGDQTSALGFYRAAFEGSAEALRRSPGDGQRLFDHMQNVFYIGDIARLRGNMKGAEAAVREYKRLSTILIASEPTNAKWQMEGIYADNNLGVLLNDRGQYSQAAAVFSNALAARERLVAANPENEEYRQAMVEVLAWLADAREKEGRIDEALAQRERQIAMLDPIIANRNSDVEYRRQAVVAYGAAGRLNALRGNVPAGIEQLQTSISMGENLLEAEPSNAEWMNLTGWSKLDLARVQLGRNAVDEAASLVRSGCDINDRLVSKDSSVVVWRVRMRGACAEFGIRIALSQGAVAEAQDKAAEMLRSTQAELARSPSADAQLALSAAYMMSGIVERAAGDPARSAASFQRAARTWPKARPDTPALIARKAIILRGSGRSAEAQGLAERLDRIGYRDAIYLTDMRNLA